MTDSLKQCRAVSLGYVPSFDFGYDEPYEGPRDEFSRSLR
jgi:hypothetical protein